MARKLKIGGTLLAVLAMSALSAQGASAAGELFHSHIEPTVVTGQSTTDVFTATGVSTKCKLVTLAGTQSVKTVSEITFHLKYAECSIGAVPDIWTSEGCTFTIHSETTANPNTAGKVDAPMTIDCTAGTTLYHETGACKIRIETPQTVHGVGFKNTGTFNTFSEGSPVKTIDLIATVDKIKYVAENTPVGGLKCGVIGIGLGTHEDGTYTGESTLKGFVDQGEVQTGEYKEGEQVGIWWE